MAVDFFTLVTNADALLTVLGSLDTTVAYAILFAVYSLETGVASVSFSARQFAAFSVRARSR